MELGLSLGDHASKPSETSGLLGLGFTTLSMGPICTRASNRQHEEPEEKEAKKQKGKQSVEDHEDRPEYVQLDLLPHTPVAVSRTNPPSQISFPWPPSENGSSSRGVDMNSLPPPLAAAAAAEEDEAAMSSSPNSAASSFQMDLGVFNRGGSSISGCKRDYDGEVYYQRAASSRASDEDDNVGSTRKKLRLSKEQSAFLEESFKEHSTLNPKQKLALAKQLNLRPRQVEVWFQNRRARTKLKQTEVDCEYLKRCCETLTEENRRLHKELQELRALKANSNPFFMQLPATTLTMCPSCERVATNNSSAVAATVVTSSATPSTTKVTETRAAIEPASSKAIGFPLSKPKFYPFAHTKTHHPHPSSPS
ncbi:homeobox-leucine zipper protein HOX11-like [Prosopis cineraria]|uniref:homeobox-leucine zipper protein HOX11-like n=1 Tax=Prosopis cineraria TaxID=364024 RepID=UPI002410818F|nr:homeobox-leucine zipper protein HOX11-like [Prosopis cineraria]